MSNNAIIYKDHPKEFPENGKHLAFEKRSFNLDEVKLERDDFVVDNLFVSIDPYQRNRMKPGGVSYAAGYPIGEPITNSGVGKIVKSSNDKFPVGTTVYGTLDWAEYTIVRAKDAATYMAIDNKYNLPLSTFVGAIGMPGMTAYSSLYEIGKPKKDETIFISAASGAVGQLVGQLAKREGLYVVGSVGSDDKVKHAKSLGFDAVFNYKTEKPNEALAKYCPKGIDIYYDNVGGETLEAAINNANLHARIVLCGMISQYNTTEPYGVKNLMLGVSKRLTLQGFIVSDLWAKYSNDFYTNMPKWLSGGEIKYHDDISDGLEKGVDAFIGMLKGQNLGKAIIGVKGKGK